MWAFDKLTVQKVIMQKYVPHEGFVCTVIEFRDVDCMGTVGYDSIAGYKMLPRNFRNEKSDIISKIFIIHYGYVVVRMLRHFSYLL